MKKKVYVSLLLILVVGVLGCRKKEVIGTNGGDVSYSIKEGRLHFSSSEEMYSLLAELSLLKKEKQLERLRKLKIKTLDVIYDDIYKAEVENQKIIYAGLSPELGLSDYEELGIIYEHTPLFNENIEKGTIIKVKEKDGWSFELFVNNPGYTSILNEEGEVLIADTLYKFIGNKLYLKKFPSGELVNELDFENEEKAASSWTRHLNGGNWIYDGSTKRFKASVYGTASTSGTSTPGGIIVSSFYVDSRAENRVFGSWGARASYMPIYSFYINWSYSYQAAPCSTCSFSTNPFPLEGSANSSPYSWHSTSDPYGQTNLLIRYFRPNGTYTLPNPWVVGSPLSVSYSSTITFSGGASGYTYNI